MQLYFRKFGSGKPVVILHGLYGSSDNWMSIGKTLSDSFEVYIPDQRNHGRSPHSERHDYRSMREDLLGLIDDQGLGKVILLGHSMGGKTAMCFAANHPERVGGLIVADIAPKSYKDSWRNEVLSHDHILRAMKEVDFSNASSLRDIDGQLADSIKSQRIRAFLMKNLDKSPDGRYSWTLNLDVLISELDNIMDDINENCFDTSSPVGNFPALFIRGGSSSYIADTDMDFIKKLFPAARLTTIADAGHWLHAEKPQDFIRRVREFVSESWPDDDGPVH
jgi:esterase